MQAKPLNQPRPSAPPGLRPTLGALGESTAVVLLVVLACFAFSF